MAEDYIQVNIPASLGRKLKAWSSVDGGGNLVDSEAVTLTDSAGNEVLPATEATSEQIALSLTPEGNVQLGNETLVSNVAVLILPANPLRRGIVLQNNGSANVRVGPPGVDVTTGIRLLPDAILTASPPFLPIDAFWAIAEAGDSVLFATEVL